MSIGIEDLLGGEGAQVSGQGAEDNSHSSLSPSSAERWFACPGSVRMSEGQPNKSSPQSAEGTATHTLGEELLTGQISEQELSKRIGTTMTTWDGFTVKVTEQMVDGAMLYVQTIRDSQAGIRKTGGSTPIEMHAEVKVVASSVDGEVRGTADCVEFQRGKALVVTDLKYGKKAVNPEKNKQLSIYAVAAMDTIAGEAYDGALLKIVQPRAGGIKEWFAPMAWLREFRKELKAAVEATRAPNAPLKAGNHCFFCPAKSICPELNKEIEDTLQTDFAVVPAPPPAERGVRQSTAGLPDVQSLPLEKVALILGWEDAIVSWLGALRSRAKNSLELGQTVPGWKLVEGRTHRKWTDPNKTVEELSFIYGLTPEDMYETPSLISPAQMEKLLPKGQKKALEELGLITRAEAHNTVVPDTDPRPAVKPATTAEMDFAPGPKVVEGVLVDPLSDEPLAHVCGTCGSVLESPTECSDPLCDGPQKTVTDLSDLERDLLG